MCPRSFYNENHNVLHTFRLSCTGPYPPNNKHIAFKDVLNLHKSMIGGYHTTRKISSNAKATYDLTGTYLTNEKEDDGKFWISSKSKLCIVP